MFPSKKLIAQIGKVSTIITGTFFMNRFIGEQGAVTFAAQLGIGAAALTTASSLVGNVMPNFIADGIKGLSDIAGQDVNHDLEKAITEAYKETLKAANKDVQTEFELRESNLTTLVNFFKLHISDELVLRQTLDNHFFPAIFNFLTTGEELQQAIQNQSLLEPQLYIENVFSRTGTETFVGIKPEELEALSNFIKLSFAKYYPIAFAKQLKINPKAKTVYFKLLLELGIGYLKEIKTDTSLLIKNVKKLNRFAVQGKLDILNKFQELEQQLGMAQNTITNLVDKTYFQQQIQLIKREISQGTQWFPALSCYTEEPQLDNLLDFRTRFATLTGRNEQLSQLVDFLDSEQTFSWWTIEGAAGSGKSRLALELCYLSKGMEYESGFLELNEVLPSIYGKFTNPFQVLIVIDNSQTSPEQTRNFLTFLHKRARTNAESVVDEQAKVRVLLIDRKFNSDWEDQMRHLKPSRYQTASLELSKLLDEDQKQIMTEVIDKVHQHQGISSSHEPNHASTQNSHLDITENSDTDQALPLYSMLIAVAKANGRPSNDWNSHDLVRAYLKSIEYDLWNQLKDFAKYRYQIRYLLTVNILARELSKEQIRKIAQQQFHLQYQELDTFLVLYQSIAIQNEHTGYRGMPHDVLASHYLAAYLLEAIREGETERLFEITDVAVNEYPEGVAMSLSYLLTDYIDHTDTETFNVLNTVVTDIMTDVHGIKDSPKRALFTMRSLYELCEINGNFRNDIERFCLPAMEHIVKDGAFSSDLRLNTLFAVAVQHYITEGSSTVLNQNIKSLIVTLIRAQENPNLYAHIFFCNILSRVYNNFVYHVRADQPDQDIFMFILNVLMPAQLDLFKLFPQDAEIAEDICACAVKMNSVVIIDGEILRNRNKIIGLIKDQFPDNEAIHEYYLSHLTKMIQYQFRDPKLALELSQYVFEAQQIQRKYPENEFITMLYAEVIFNEATILLNAGRNFLLSECFNSLSSLYHQHPNQPIAKMLGSCQLSRMLVINYEPTATSLLISEMRMIMDDFPDQTDLVNEYIQLLGKVSLFNQHAGIDDTQTTAELDLLFQTYRFDQGILAFEEEYNKQRKI